MILITMLRCVLNGKPKYKPAPIPNDDVGSLIDSESLSRFRDSASPSSLPVDEKMRLIREVSTHWDSVPALSAKGEQCYAAMTEGTLGQNPQMMQMMTMMQENQRPVVTLLRGGPAALPASVLHDARASKC